MLSSLSSGLSGLQAGQTFLDVIGANLANAGTVGYRGSRVTFSDLLSDLIRPGIGPTGALGGLNPIQVGRGVRVASTDVDITQGDLNSTGRGLDLGIRGNGFFVLNDGRNDYFTRVGSFDVDSTGRLVDTRTGYRVRSATGGDITIPFASTIPAQATNSVRFAGNLPAEITGPAIEILTTGAPLLEGTSASLAGSVSEPYAPLAGDSFTIRVDGGAAQTVTLAGTETTAALVAAAINAQTTGLTAVDAGGTVTITSDTAGADSSLDVDAGTIDPSVVFGLSLASTSGTESAALATTDLNDLLANTTDYLAGDTIVLTGTDADGTAVSATFTYGVDGTTLGDLVTFADGAFAGATASLDVDGNIVLTADEAGDVPLALAFADGSSNTGATDFNDHAFAVTTAGADPDSATTSREVFDSLGRAHTVTFVFERRNASLWDLTAEIDSADGTVVDGRVEGIQFADDGTLSGITGSGVGDPRLSFSFEGLTGAQEITVDLGLAGSGESVTQTGGDTTLFAASQDGYASGSLASYSVGSDGSVVGFYTNGLSQTIDQLRIANFNNPGGLARIGDTLYSASANSGDPVFTTAQAGGAGDVVAGVLEGSNVDIAREFVQLILAQRGFQVNARVITTSDNVLQELINIVR